MAHTDKLKSGSEFVRHTLILTMGTAVSQAVLIAISPILTRLYTPNDFGIFALYMSLTSLLSIMVTGRYELAIMLPGRNKHAKHILVLSVLITLIVSSIIFIVLYVFNFKITELLGTEEISVWLYLIPLSVFLNGLYQSLTYWKNRNEEFRDIAVGKITNSSANAVANLTFGFFQQGVFGLIFGTVLGKITGILSLLNIKNTFFPYKFKCNEIIVLAKKYKKFPFVNTWHAFINLLKNNLVHIYINLKYATGILGFYYFVLKIMQYPSGILGSSIARIFYKNASEHFNSTKNIRLMVKNQIKILSILGGIPAVLFFFNAEKIFVFIFGKNWAVAGNYAQALIPYIYFHFIASPLSMVPLITDYQDKAFYWGMLESILFVSSFVAGYYVFKDLYYSLLMLSIIFSVYFPIYFLWILKISKSSR